MDRPTADGSTGGDTYPLHLGLVLSGGEGGGVAFLLQVNPHELINGQLAGGCVLKLC